MSSKLDWLRAAAKQRFDAADRGEYTVLRSRKELHAFLAKIHEQVAAEIAAEPERPHIRDTVMAIQDGTASAARGELKPAAQVLAEMRAKYDLSR